MRINVLHVRTCVQQNTLRLFAYTYLITTSVAKLSADNSSISAVPAVVTDGAPASMKTHLQSSLVLIAASNKTDCPTGAVRGGICSQQKEN